MIHLLSHDPDFTKPHEYEQLKDIKEWVLVLTADNVLKKYSNSIEILFYFDSEIQSSGDWTVTYSVFIVLVLIW